MTLASVMQLTCKFSDIDRKKTGEKQQNTRKIQCKICNMQIYNGHMPHPDIHFKKKRKLDRITDYEWKFFAYTVSS